MNVRNSVSLGLLAAALAACQPKTEQSESAGASGASPTSAARVEITEPAGDATISNPVKVTLVATGSEVSLCLDVRAALEDAGISARVTSVPSWEILRGLGDGRRDELIPPGVPSVSVEMGATQGWRAWVDHAIGVDRFGASAPASEVLAHYGFTAPQIAAQVRALLQIA